MKRIRGLGPIVQSASKANNIAIQLTNVGKKYEIHHEKPTLVERFVRGKNETFWALKDVNLTVYKGERLGIMGPNGCGKTTLLKVIAGITAPTNGDITVHGRVASLIDLEAGFHPDLNGLQNIYVNGLLIGMSKVSIDKKYRHIISFADIKQFIDVPLYTYSQGMMLRLGFSIGIYSDPEIFILDENIIVGDEDFQKKSQKILNNTVSRGKTVIIVSHSVEYITRYCSRIITMKNGKIQNG